MIGSTQACYLELMLLTLHYKRLWNQCENASFLDKDHIQPGIPLNDTRASRGIVWPSLCVYHLAGLLPIIYISDLKGPSILQVSLQTYRCTYLSRDQRGLERPKDMEKIVKPSYIHTISFLEAFHAMQQVWRTRDRINEIECRGAARKPSPDTRVC